MDSGQTSRTHYTRIYSFKTFKCFWNVYPKSPAQTQLRELSSPLSLEGDLVQDCKNWLSSVICISCHHWGFETHCARHCTNMRQLHSFLLPRQCWMECSRAHLKRLKRAEGGREMKVQLRVFGHCRPAVFIAKWFHIFLIIVSWWMRKIPRIILCQSNSGVIRGRGEDPKGFLKEQQNYAIVSMNFVAKHCRGKGHGCYG